MTMQWRVILSDVNIDEREMAAVREVLASRWLSMGAITQSFEEAFAAAHGAAAAVAVSSGTAALHLAALALGLGADDEVIVPSLTFVASAATIALTGARPVFAEIKGPHDLTLDPADVASKITPRTRAIVVVHYAGYPAAISEIVTLARRHGLAVIEDAAHAPAVHTGHGALGTIGDIGCFSFFATKNLTTGEGGMVIARDPVILQRVRSLRGHCMTTTTWDKHHGRASAYDVTGLGLNYRPTEITAALGRVQLEKLPTDRACRAGLVERYHRRLRQIKGLDLPFADHTGDTAYHLLPILLPDEVQQSVVQEQLRSRGIQSSVHYPPIHLFSFYREQYGYHAGDLPQTEAIAARELSLPLHTLMTSADVDLVTDALCEILAEIRV
jgi:dTDP-4-amino-4,6-dideoxygalactose transaminase